MKYLIKNTGTILVLILGSAIMNAFMTSYVLDQKDFNANLNPAVESRLLKMENTIKKWDTNRPDTFFVFDTIRVVFPGMVPSPAKRKVKKSSTSFAPGVTLRVNSKVDFRKGHEEADLLYIEKYKDLALSEQSKYGIPASIKLAQGIIESNAGRSNLASVAHNHFGIKKYGKTFLYNTSLNDHILGEQLASDDCGSSKCRFIKFDRAWASYRAHSMLLSGSKRYKGLFDLDGSDYKGWAKGLKDAGYATSPIYTQTLIKCIEKYNLFNLDNNQSL